MIYCLSCHQPYPQDSTPYRCPACGGLYDFDSFPSFDPTLITHEPGIWRYRHTFNLPPTAPRIYLGEGDTPLVWDTAFGGEVAFKLEYLNPTSSFKDRGIAVTVSFLCSRHVSAAMDDSSGNAGASFAAYAASAGIKASIFVPAYASGPKRQQISAYGAEVVAIPGPRSKTSDAIRQEAKHGAVYASHAMLPQGLPGYATTAFELVEQLGTSPGTVILPVGQGNLLLAMGRAFQSLHRAGLIQTIPQLIGVQANACAPLWVAFTRGLDATAGLHEGSTLAEGVRISSPHRLETLLDIVRSSQGMFITVQEDDILPGQCALAHRGFFVEPTSAIVWNALEQVMDHSPHPIVAILTGSGLKAGL
jgi:threonine synthase